MVEVNVAWRVVNLDVTELKYRWHKIMKIFGPYYLPSAK